MKDRAPEIVTEEDYRDAIAFTDARTSAWTNLSEYPFCFAQTAEPSIPDDEEMADLEELRPEP